MPWSLIATGLSLAMPFGVTTPGLTVEYLGTVMRPVSSTRESIGVIAPAQTAAGTKLKARKRKRAISLLNLSVHSTR